MTKFLRADNGESLTSGNRPEKWEQGQKDSDEMIKKETVHDKILKG